MLLVKLVDQFLRIPGILRTVPASPSVTVTRPLHKIMELPVASLTVEDPVNFPFIRVVDNRWLRSNGRWPAVGGVYRSSKER